MNVGRVLAVVTETCIKNLGYAGSLEGNHFFHTNPLYPNFWSLFCIIRFSHILLDMTYSVLINLDFVQVTPHRMCYCM